MSREIKFRAWDKEINAMGMVYCFDFSIEEVSIMFPKLTKIDGKVQKDSIGTQAFIEEIELMQFTGFVYDMEIEIYEGDIVKTPQGIIGKIVDELGKFIIVSKKFEDGYEDLCEYHSEDNYCDLEVIGNIYENPELLDASGGNSAQ